MSSISRSESRSGSGHWSIERRGAIAVATFTRPPRNFMSFAAMTELEALLTELARDQSVTVVVLTGGVPGYFVAHADLDDLQRIGRGEPVEGDPGSWGRTMALIEAMPQPVVAAVDGQAWGGGCELALACTMRIASTAAHFGQPEVNVGIIPGAGGTQRLPRLIGPGRAADLILSGRIVDAGEALALGLVNAVLPVEGFLDHALQWADGVARRPRSAVVAAKRAIVDGLRLPFDDGIRLEGSLFLQLQAGSEAIDLEHAASERYASAADDDHIEL